MQTNCNILIALLFFCLCSQVCSEKFKLYVGTWSSNIYILQYDSETNQLTSLANITSVERPSFLAFANNTLYAVSETMQFEHQNKTGGFYTLQKQQVVDAVASKGESPCYVEIDTTGTNALVANYGSEVVTDRSSFAIFKIANGKLKLAQVLPGVLAHEFVVSPDQMFAFGIDKGADRVYQYTFHPGNTENVVVPNKHDQFLTFPKGSGPRHLAFHPVLKTAYLIRETDSTVSVLAYNDADGTFSFLQNITTVPSFVDPKRNTGSEIQVSPDGMFVYGTNRGSADGFVIYSVNQFNGLLTLVGHESSFGAIPRHFSISKSGTFVFVANQNSNNIAVFLRKPSGYLHFLKSMEGLEKPTFIAALQE